MDPTSQPPRPRHAPRRSSGAGSVVLVALTLLVVTLLGRPWPLAAQDIPADVAELDEAAAVRALPDAPAGFVREQRGEVIWEFPSQAMSIARDLQEVHRNAWPRLVEELGGPVDGSLMIRIGLNPEQMRALAPPGAPPPGYASGVAYPPRGLILLTLTAPETWQRPDMDTILVHELSHVALHRAVRGRAIPRWFSEGVAIHQADERSIERMRALWGGTVGSRLLPFESLDRSFSTHPHRVNLAYAQSADFVRWLRAREGGERKFRQVIGRLRDGQSFQTALERTYSVTVTTLEADWHESLAERFQAMPLLVGSGTLWVLAAVLIVVAYVRRRRRDRDKLDEWEEEERAEAAEQVLLASRAVSHTLAGPSPSAPEEEYEVLYVVPPEPVRRDSGIPTIEHEGRSHTLH